MYNSYRHNGCSLYPSFNTSLITLPLNDNCSFVLIFIYFFKLYKLRRAVDIGSIHLLIVIVSGWHFVWFVYDSRQPMLDCYHLKRPPAIVNIERVNIG